MQRTVILTLRSAAVHTVRFERIRVVLGTEPPPAILDVAWKPEARATRIRWASIEGIRYRVDASRDLSSWEQAGTIAATARSSEFVDTLPTPGLRRRSFRVVRVFGE